MKDRRVAREYTVRPEKLIFGGSALARDGRFVLFVDDALPGETVRVRPYRKKKSFAFCRLLEVIEAAPERVPVDCGWAGRCGGCSYRHCAYPGQLRFKKGILVDALHGLPEAQALVADPVGAESPFDYRNKMDFGFGLDRDGRAVLGLHHRGSFMHILPADQCRLQSEASRELVRRITALVREMSVPVFHEIRKTHGLRLLTVREARRTGQRMLELISTADDPEFNEQFLQTVDDLADSVYLSISTGLHGHARGDVRSLRKGPGFIEEHLNGLKFRIGPDTFFQNNTEQAEKLFRRLQELAVRHGRPAVALDLFAGTGPIALHLAGAADRVIGVESWQPSVEAAQKNLKLNQISNVDMIAADVNEALPPGIPPHADLVVVDPPRPGLTPESIEWITRLTPDSILYVSCNPSTLARDLVRFREHGYAPEVIEPFDLFPYTYHLETLVLLRR